MTKLTKAEREMIAAIHNPKRRVADWSMKDFLATGGADFYTTFDQLYDILRKLTAAKKKQKRKAQ